MNNKLLFFFTFLLFFGFIGCGKVSTPFMDSDVSLVKDGTLRFDKSLKLGQAIDNYKYFKNVKWSSITSDNGKHIVRVIADIDIDKMRPDWKDIVSNIAKEQAPKRSFMRPAYYEIMNSVINKIDRIKNIKIEIQFIVNVDKTFNPSWSGIALELNDDSKIDSNNNEEDMERLLEHIYANKPIKMPMDDIPATAEKQEEQPRNQEAPVGSADAPAVSSSPTAIQSSPARPEKQNFSPSGSTWTIRSWNSRSGSSC